MSDRVAAFLAMLERGQDSALLRFSLGNEYLSRDACDEAAEHLLAATRLDENYSAAWKLLGKAYSKAGDPRRALDAYRCGIGVAEKNGDRQSAREMQVFARRIEKELADE